MPPWIIPELAPEAPEATSFFSNIKVLRPRIAASRAIPVPFTPPPITITSNSAGAVIFCCSLQQGVEKLLRSPPALLRSPWRAHVLPRTLRAPGPTAPRIWACSRRFSTPCWAGRVFRPAGAGDARVFGPQLAADRRPRARVYRTGDSRPGAKEKLDRAFLQC